MKWIAIFGSTVTLCGFLTVQPLWADAFSLPSFLPEFLLHNAQGYLGVYLREAKVPHAAEIVMLDHDAPASKSGLKVHDVILQLDGRSFDNVEQLRHKLHSMPAGRTVSLLISREDGSRLSVAVQLCDQRTLQQSAWLHHFSVPPPVASGFVDQGPSRGPNFLDNMIPIPRACTWERM